MQGGDVSGAEKPLRGGGMGLFKESSRSAAMPEGWWTQHSLPKPWRGA